jgi:hypothetical protein
MSHIPSLRWQNARAPLAVASNDTPLTNYEQADLVDAVQKKMIGVDPYSTIMVRVFGTDAANETGDIIVSGWMHPFTQTGANFGHRLARMLVTLGSKGVAKPPTNLPDGAGGKWAASGTTYLEADTYATGGGGDYDMVGVKILDSALTATGIANQEACVIIPTLGYSHLLFEIVSNTAASLGIIWRPIGRGGVEPIGVPLAS